MMQQRNTMFWAFLILTLFGMMIPTTGHILKKKLARVMQPQQQEKADKIEKIESAPPAQILAQFGSIAKLNDALMQNAFDTQRIESEKLQKPNFILLDSANEAMKNQKSFAPTSEQFQTALGLAQKPVMPLAFQLQNAGITVPSDGKDTILGEINMEQKMKDWGSMCWKRTLPNGVGVIKNGCPSDHASFENGLCYVPCNSNEHSDGATQCILNQCPQNYYSSGIYTCQWNGPLTFLKGGCCTIFSTQWCNYNCPPNYGDDGMCSCTVKIGVPTTTLKSRTRGIGLIPTKCPAGTVQDPSGLLCYPPCPSESKMVGPVCWHQCPASAPVDCGAACGVSDCSGIFNMVIAPLQVVVDIATGGTLGTAIRSGITAAKTAIKTGVSALVKGAAAKLAEGFTKESVKSTLVSMASKAGKVLQSGVVDKIIEAASQPNPAGPIATTVIDAISDVDPTGLTAVVGAFMHPLC